ncbi:MAG TPA: circadian clock protein KaiC [Longimicrobium sp.]|nr:circadian clock protein KaiC [Longimicrobium sp.]
MTDSTGASAAPQPFPKLPTGIEGFDVIAEGGVPAGRTTLVGGTAGSGKTIFAAQFLAEGIRQGEKGVFITFEESPEELSRNLVSLGWDVPGWEASGAWTYVDGSPDEEASDVVGEFDLGALLARITRAVRQSGARRVSIDGVNALFSRLPNPEKLRGELYRVSRALRELGATTLVTAERLDDYGEVSRFGIEEFVADNVVLLRNTLQDERRRRTVEILKFRGTAHQRGEFPFTIAPERGVVVLPLSAMTLTQRSSTTRISSGIPELDHMLGGGYFRDSIILLSGATGTGKTLTVTHFIAGGVAAGDRCMLFAFEESREQLVRNARSWGYDFEAMERGGLLRIIPVYPHAMPLEDHLLRMRWAIQEFKPQRVAVDSLSALERVTSLRSFREFMLGLTSLLKHGEIAGMVTSTAPSILGGHSVTEKHISTLTDTILLLRYVEMNGELRRGLLVLKMRGSAHDTTIREYTIDGDGLHLGVPFHGTSGILSGNITHGRAEDEEVAPGEGPEPAEDLEPT